MATLTRTERIWINGTKEIDDLAYAAKRLWNEAIAIIQNEPQNQWMKDANLLQRMLRAGSLHWQAFPVASIPENIINKELMKAWKGFFASLKAYQAHPEKFMARPQAPSFKSGKAAIPFRDRGCQIDSHGVLTLFPTKLNWKFQTRLTPNCKPRLVRLVPKPDGRYLLFITYDIESTAISTAKKGRYMGIDLGLKYLATVANNFGAEAFAISGGPLTSALSAARHEANRLSSLSKIEANAYGKKHFREGPQMAKLRNNVENLKYNAIHDISSTIRDFAIKNHVEKVVIGYNELWKQNLEQEKKLGKRVRRDFCSVPHATLVDYLTYKLTDSGIEVVMIEESYTSKCSFFDGETVGKHEVYAGHRGPRGCFTTKIGMQIHSDLNGAYNMIRKGIPEVVFNLRNCDKQPHILSMRIDRMKPQSCMALEADESSRGFIYPLTTDGLAKINDVSRTLKETAEAM
jgi:putative transposase